MFDQEMILRFFAFHYHLEEYSGSLQEFLNHFMFINRDLEKISEIELKQLFKSTLNFIHKTLGETAFEYNNRFNVSYYETIMVLTSKYHLMDKNPSVIQQLVEKLRVNEEFASSIRSSTTTKKNVMTRFYLCFNLLEALLK